KCRGYFAAGPKGPPRNKQIGSSFGNRRVYGVVPFAVKGVGLEVDQCEFLVGDSTTARVDALIEATSHREARLGGRGRDQADDNLMGDERLAAPVLGDEGEQAVLDLVPFARSWGQVT